MERYLCEAVVPSDTARAKPVIDAVLSIATAHEFGEQALFGIHLSLEEALMNAMKHGNSLDITKFVTMSCEVTEGVIVIKIADEGPGFNPESVPDPTEPEFIDRPHGRGLMLIRSFMAEVKWNGRGNEIEMKQIRKEPGKVENHRFTLPPETEAALKRSPQLFHVLDPVSYGLMRSFRTEDELRDYLNVQTFTGPPIVWGGK